MKKKKIMRNQYAIHVLEGDIRRKKDALCDLDNRKEETFGKEEVEKLRNQIKGNIRDLEKAIDILETTWK